MESIRQEKFMKIHYNTGDSTGKEKSCTNQIWVQQSHTIFELWNKRVQMN